jgi:hypothetical protein
VVRARLLKNLLRGDPDPAIRADTGMEPESADRMHAQVAYFEPRMQDQGGHFHHLAASYESFFRERSLDTLLLHHREWRGPSRARSRSAFSIADHAVGYEKLSSQGQMAAFECYFSAVTSRWLRASGAAMAIFPTARFLTLPGYLDAVEESDMVRGAVLGVMETWPVPDCDDEQLVIRAFEDSASVVRESAKAYLVIAESAPVRDWLLARGFPDSVISISPYVAAARFTARERPVGARADQTHFGYLGGTRPVQNPGLMARCFLDSEPLPGAWSVRLDLKLVARELDMRPRSLRRRLRARGVRLLPGHLENTDYDDLFRLIDVMVLPYAERYETIGSGLFLECLCAGVAPLLPARSTMRTLYEDLGGLAPVIDPVTPGGIAEAVLQCSAQREALLDNAGLVRKNWLSHTWGPVAWRAAMGRWLEAIERSPAG